MDPMDGMDRNDDQETTGRVSFWSIPSIAVHSSLPLVSFAV